MLKQIVRWRYVFLAFSSSILLLFLLGGGSLTAFAASRNAAHPTLAVSGTVTALPTGLPFNAGNNQEPVGISLSTSLQFRNFASQSFTVEVIDKATGAQIISQPEQTDSNGQNNDYQLIQTQQQFATISPAGWKVKIKANGLIPVSASINSSSGIATFDTATTLETTTTGTPSNGQTNVVTGSVEVFNLPDTTNRFPVAINLKIANAANQQFTVAITDQATGTQVLRQQETTDAQGLLSRSTTTTNTQELAFDPNNTWVVTITDANGNQQGPTISLGSTGQVAMATFAATN